MRRLTDLRRPLVAAFAIVLATAGSGWGALPPGRPYVLTIKGENNVTFVPEIRRPPVRVEYKAAIEYLVNTRDIQQAAAKKGATARKKTRRSGSKAQGRDSDEADDSDNPRAAAVVDLALHSAELNHKNSMGVAIQTRVSRSRFQGQFSPEMPPLSVTYYQAPPPLQAMLERFDATSASLLIDDRAHVMDRRIRFEGPLTAIVETLLSIHTPIPKDVGAWEAPTELAMGHGQTAKGTLRFEKDKASKPSGEGLVNVKVAGVLKAEGAIVGNLIKDGTYTVTGEQSYDPKTREWTSAKWSVEIATELANQGATVAHGRGKMLVECRALAGAPASDSAKSKRKGSPKATPAVSRAPG